ncbi:unnamed protein product [Lampetra planeri]
MHCTCGGAQLVPRSMAEEDGGVMRSDEGDALVLGGPSLVRATAASSATTAGCQGTSPRGAVLHDDDGSGRHHHLPRLPATAVPPLVVASAGTSTPDISGDHGACDATLGWSHDEWGRLQTEDASIEIAAPRQ